MCGIWVFRNNLQRWLNSASSNNRKKTLEKALKELLASRNSQHRTIATSISSSDVNAGVHENWRVITNACSRTRLTPRRWSRRYKARKFVLVKTKYKWIEETETTDIWVIQNSNIKMESSNPKQLKIWDTRKYTPGRLKSSIISNCKRWLKKHERKSTQDLSSNPN